MARNRDQGLSQRWLFPRPRVRVPHEGLCPWRVYPGRFILDGEQSPEEALEVAVYLQTWLTLTDPEGSNNIHERRRQACGGAN